MALTFQISKLQNAKETAEIKIPAPHRIPATIRLSLLHISILLTFGLFFLGIVVCFYIVRRPTRPYLSGTCLFLLILFLACTAVVNASLPPVSQFDWGNAFLRKLTPFVVFRYQPTQEECERSFQVYQACLLYTSRGV